jgi:hypothetical protein
MKRKARGTSATGACTKAIATPPIDDKAAAEINSRRRPKDPPTRLVIQVPIALPTNPAASTNPIAVALKPVRDK